MKSYTCFLVVCLLLASTQFCGAQTPAPGQGAVGAPTPTVSTFPYVAEITGNDVYVRSGPGTNYYNCGKLTKGDKVRVVKTQFSWSCIVPPKESFSWISMRYVSIDYEDPNVGIVTEDNVRVFAGSDRVRPIHSTSLQGKMDSGEKVRLLGEQKENYYKIEPPAFAYLWVSTKYAKPYVPPIEVPEVPEIPTETPEEDKEPEIQTTTPEDEQATPPVEPTDTGPVKPVKPVIPPMMMSMEAKKLAEYKELAQRIKAEKAKPMDQQDYSRIKRELLDIVNNKNAGKAARYSEHVVKQIERFELAFAIAKQIQLQEVRSQKTRQDIEKAREARLAKVKDIGNFAVTGKLASSSIYGADSAVKYYRVLDASGKTVCYAASSLVDADKFVGKQVGLVGTIEPHPQSGTALVKFTKIVEME